MRPRSKFQKKCLSLFLENHECPEDVRDWAISYFLTPVAGFPCGSKQQNCYCSRCGNLIKISAGAGALTCRNCGAEVAVREDWQNKRVQRSKHKFELYRVIDGIQFIFFYEMSAALRKKHAFEATFKPYGAVVLDRNTWIAIRKPFYSTTEVYPEFRVYTPRDWYVGLSSTSPMAMSRRPESFFKKEIVTCPIIDLLPKFKNIGLTRNVIEALRSVRFPSYYKLFSVFPDFRCIEIAAKKGDLEFLRTIISNEHIDDAHDCAYLIANRHNYIASDWNLWWNMITLLAAADKDILDPRYVCPDDINVGHDLANQIYIEDTPERFKRERLKELEDLRRNGPYDVEWHLNFNPDCDKTDFINLLREYGYDRDRHPACNKGDREIMLLRPHYMSSTNSWDIYPDRVPFLTDFDDQLLPEYKDLGIELTSNNIILNPEVIPQIEQINNCRLNNFRPGGYSVEKENEFKLMRSQFNDLVFKDTELTLMTLDSALEYYQESLKMSNCLWAFDLLLNPETLFMSARIDGKPVADVEISLRDFSIVQCYGPCNQSTPYKERISNLIQANADEIRARMAEE